MILSAEICQRATDAHDARFDGVFFIGITSTGIYCRPICPARVAYPDHRRFFTCAAEAERAGYRPCLRCRPELAPGRALCEAVSRLAFAAAHRIRAGALNGRSVAQLARELAVSERHLRRALQREIGVSPVELAQTHRLLLAKRLLTDTALPVTRIAYASGFQSLRRFNSVFRERYRMSPSAIRRTVKSDGSARESSDLLRLTLAYRPPLAWDGVLAFLRRNLTPGVEVVDGRRYSRTISLDGHRGVVVVGDDAGTRAGTRSHFNVKLSVSTSLVSVLMPLVARLRRLFDLDAEPCAIDAHLEQGGLRPFIRQRPGLRMVGALDGFEVALQVLLRDGIRATAAGCERARRVAHALGEPLEAGTPALGLLTPTAERVADAGAARLAALGVPRRRAAALEAIARAIAEGTLCLEPGNDIDATRRALIEIGGIGDRLATMIVMRALYWPDAFPASDRALQRTAGVSDERSLRAWAEQWRPWRAYAALHLWSHAWSHANAH